MKVRDQTDRATKALPESEQRVRRAKEFAHVGDCEWEPATDAVR